MAASELGPWEPLELTEVSDTFVGAPFRWWVSGGHALELHLGRAWRNHDDTDVGVVRSDLTAVHDWLSSWDLHVGADGVLTPWRGETLDANRQQNNVWCRRTTTSPWALDVTIGDGSDTEWIYRRDPAVRRPWADAVLRTDDSVPYLAPQIQLLFKSKSVRPKDDVDARQVIPELSEERRSWLAEQLPAGHPWHRLAR